MQFTRHNLHLLGAATSAELCNHLKLGRWMVEARTRPPSSHTPERLLAQQNLECGFAVSLCSATLLKLDLGLAVIDRIAMEGCIVADLAALALHEVLVNAVVHGNLNVESGRSATWSDLSARHCLTGAALADPVKSRRVVTLALGWNAAKVDAVIMDEGCGAVVEPGAGVQSSQKRAAGRGLLFARSLARVDVTADGHGISLQFRRLSSADNS